MNLTERINRFHENYVFPVANGFVGPFLIATSIDNYNAQIQRAHLRDLEEIHLKAYETERQDLARLLNFSGVVTSAQLMPFLFDEFGGYMAFALLVTNAVSHVYHKGKPQTHSRDSNQTSTP